MRDHIGKQLISVVVAALLIGSVVFVSGPVVAQSGDGFEVDVAFPGDDGYTGDANEFTAETNQTIEVQVTNTDSEELVSPLIEIPVGNDFSINDSSVGQNEITVVTNSSSDPTEEQRNSYVDDSTYHTGNALFIEGQAVAAGETNTYEVTIDVDSPGDVDVGVDARPLNNEPNNDRDTYTQDALGFGTINVNSDTVVTITGEHTDITDNNDFTTDVIADRSYTVEGEIDLLDDNVTIETVEPELFNTESVWFSDTTSAGEPTVVARNASGVDIVSINDRIDRGTAKEPTVQEITYTLISDGGQVYLVLENDADLGPLSDDPVDVSIADGEIDKIDDPSDEILVKISTDGGTDGSFEFVGYPVGDVTEDGDVTADDAAEIADAVAAGDSDSINRYGDVTNDDEISVVDAMMIQQYSDDNRPADYERGGGS